MFGKTALACVISAATLFLGLNSLQAQEEREERRSEEMQAQERRTGDRQMRRTADQEMDDEVWVYLSDEPSRLMSEALDEIDDDRDESAFKIRKAAAFVRLEARRASGENRNELMTASQNLRALARDVASGEVRSEKQLRQVFARTEYALARHHRQMAQTSWDERQDRRGASWELSAAQRNIQQGMEWTGRKAKSGAENVWEGVTMVPRKIWEGAEWTGDQIGRGFNAVGDQMRDFAEAVMPGEQGGEVRTRQQAGGSQRPDQDQEIDY